MDFRILGPLEVREGERRSRWGAASSAPCSPFSSSIAIKRSRPTGSSTSLGRAVAADGREDRPNHVLQLRRALENGARRAPTW